MASTAETVLLPVIELEVFSTGGNVQMADNAHQKD